MKIDGYYVLFIASIILNVLAMIIPCWIDASIVPANSIWIPIAITIICLLLSSPMILGMISKADAFVFIFFVPLVSLLLIVKTPIDSALVYIIWRIVVAIAYVYLTIAMINESSKDTILRKDLVRLNNNCDANRAGFEYLTKLAKHNGKAKEDLKVEEDLKGESK